MRALPLLLLLVPGAALAHAGESHAGWTLDLWVTGPLAVSALLYAIGYARLRARSGEGRPALARSALLFAAGWAVLAAAVVSPLHEAGETSFTMHMIEHEILMLPAALLLVAARPGAAMLWGLPQGLRATLGRGARGGRGAWRFVTDPVVATILQLAVMWSWHVPGAFDAALRSEVWHIAQHLSFLVSALLFWWAMLHGRSGRHGYGLVAFCLFLTSLMGGALGALMAFSGSPWYETYAALGMTPAGLTPAEDQQLAGLIMWLPGGAFHGAAALLSLLKWLRASEVGHALVAE